MAESASVQKLITFGSEPVRITPGRNHAGAYLLAPVDGDLWVVLYVDGKAGTVTVSRAAESQALLIDVPEGFQQNDLQKVVDKWKFDGAGDGGGGGIPDVVKPRP